MRGLNLHAIRDLHQSALRLAGVPRAERRTKAVALVRQYLEDPRQSEARREASEDEGASAARVHGFQAEWILDDSGNLHKSWVIDAQGRLDSLAAEYMQDLLRAAREDRIAYDAARPAIAALVRANVIDDDLRAFIADDFAGLIRPTKKTRRRSPREWVQAQQMAQAAAALISAGLTDNAACVAVAEAAQLAGVSAPKGATYQTVTADHVRRAMRSARSQEPKLGLFAT